jgi:hypothetical protein
MTTKTKAKTAELYKTNVDRAQIVLDAETQTRPGGTEPEIAAEYAASRAAGLWDWTTAPAILFQDKHGSDDPADWRYYPGDAHHRLTGCEDEAIYAIVYEGTARDARFYSLTQANKSHGLRLSKDDRRYHARLLLTDPEWVKMSDRVIADHVGLSHPTIGKIREALEDDGTIAASTDRTGADGKTRKGVESDFQIGDWIQGKLITGNATTEGYVTSIGRKNLKLMRDGKPFVVLAADAKMLCRLPEEVQPYAKFFGAKRFDLAVQVLKDVWDDRALHHLTSTKLFRYETYKGWQIERGENDDEGTVWHLAIVHPEYGGLLQAKVTHEATIGFPLSKTVAEAAIDLIESVFGQIPINPVESGRIQLEILPLDEAAQMDASKPEATERPSGEVQRELKEVDNSELDKKKPNALPETADEVTMRLRLLIGQVEPEIAARLMAEKYGAEELGQSIAKTLNDTCLKEFADGLCGQLAIHRFVNAFEWEFLAGVITDADEGIEPPEAWSWASHLTDIYRNIGEEAFAKILGGNDLYKGAIALLNPTPKATKTTGRKKAA